MMVVNGRVSSFRGDIVSLLLRWIEKNIAIAHLCQKFVDGYVYKLVK